MKYLKHYLPTLVTVFVLTALLMHWGWLEPLQYKAVEFVCSIRQGMQQGYQQYEDVYVIEINDQNFHQMFYGSTPLDPKVLRKVLDSIRKGGPKLIAVDIDTSDSSRYKTFSQIEPPPVIWGADAVPSALNDNNGIWGRLIQTLNIFNDGERQFGPLPALGGKAGTSFGLTIIPISEEGIVRRYYRQLHTPTGDLIDSFPWKIVRTCLSQTGKTEPPSEEREQFVMFADINAVRKMSLDSLMTAAKESYWQTNAPIRNKIVILGGTYRGLKDNFETSVGTLPGVIVNAQIVQCELNKTVLNVPDRHFITFIQVILSLAFIATYKRLEKASRTLKVSISIFVTSITIAILISFPATALYLSIIIAAVFIQFLHELLPKFVKDLQFDLVKSTTHK